MYDLGQSAPNTITTVPSASQNTKFEGAIREAVENNPEYYAKSYDSFLQSVVGNRRDVESMIIAFDERLRDVKGTLYGDVIKTEDGNMLLFPEAKKDYKPATVIPNSLEAILTRLENRFGIGFSIVDDKDAKFKGRYINDGNTKVVIVNLAYATKDTPFHEYFHPFVRILKQENPALFNSIYQEAYKEVDPSAKQDREEVVTEYLGRNAANKKEPTSLQIFFQWVNNLFRKAFGVKTSIDRLTTLGEVMNFLDGKVDLTKENTLTSANQNILAALKAMKNNENSSFTDRKDTSGTDYIKEFIALSKANALVTSDASNFYQDAAGNNVAKRLTAFVGDRELGEFSLRFKNQPYTFPEFKTRLLFKQYGKNLDGIKADAITDTIEIEGKQVTFQELLQGFEKEAGKQRVYGKMVHAFLQYLLEEDAVAKEAARVEASKYATELDTPFTTLMSHPDLKPYADNLQEIVKAAGIYIDVDGTSRISEERKDRIAPEVTLLSNLITDKEGNKLATTVDGLIQHYNGDLSMIDWKTGNIASDMDSNHMMAYGEKWGIQDSKLNRGYLELALRAMIIKEHFPTARFRDIKIMKLSKTGTATPMVLDLQPFISMIGEYYKQNKPDVHKELESKGLLDQSTYDGTPLSLIKVYANPAIQGLPLEEQLAYLKSKLAAMSFAIKSATLEKTPKLQQQVQLYTDAILELSKLSGVSLNAKVEDISATTGMFKNFSDVANPKIQTLHKVILEAKDEMNREVGAMQEEHDKYYKALLKEQVQGSRKFVDNIATFAYGTAIVFNPFTIPLVMLSHIVAKRYFKSTTDMFGFMWKKSTSLANPGYFLNTSNVGLTKAQREYRDHVVNSMRQTYADTMNTIVDTSPNGRPILKHERLGLPAVLPDNFLPRIPKTLQEKQEELKGIDFAKAGLGFVTSFQHAVKLNMTNFLESQYTKGDDPIPLKYYGHEGYTSVEGATHSFNVEHAYKMFMGNLLYKKHHDDLYNLAVGVKSALQEETNEKGEPTNPMLTKWLDNEIYSQILNKRKESKITSRNWTYQVGKIGNKVLDLPIGTTLTINQEAVLRSLKSFITFSAMAFKVVSATYNFVMVTVTNTMQSSAKAIANLMGVPPDNFSPDVKTTAAGWSDTISYFKNVMLGKQDQTKIHNIAKKFNWLAENYDYNIDKKEFLSASINLTSTSYAYMFHGFAEKYASYWHLATLLRSLKLRDVNGNEFSAWEAYDNEGNWIKGSRGTVEAGDTGVRTELKELDIREIKNLKRANERLHGSYRQEEKTAIESTIIGEFLFQFKKYFYQYLKVLYGSEYKDITIGKYVLDRTKPPEMGAMQWESEVMEGRVKILYSSIAAMVKAKDWRGELYNNDKFGSNVNRSSKAKQMAALINTGLWLTGLMLAYGMFFDDDDRDTFLARRFRQLQKDASMALDVRDIFQGAELPVAAADKVSKIGNSMIEFITEGALGETTKDGWLRGSKKLARSIPPFSTALQFQDLLKDYDLQSDVNLFGVMPKR